MLPLAPIRILLLGLISWMILGAGIYLCYDAYRLFNAQNTASSFSDTEFAVVTQSEDPVEIDRVASGRTLPVNGPSASELWGKLGLGVLCLCITFVGRLPVQLVFRSSSGEQAATQATEPIATGNFTIEGSGGSRLYGQVYDSLNPDDNQLTLILTHGWSLDSSAWKYLLPQLIANYRIVTWDLPGLGKSVGPKNGDYSLDKMAVDLRAVIEHTCPRGPAILVGHSIGGMIQQTFCRTHANMLQATVKGMVLVHTTYTNPLKTNMAAGLAVLLQPLIRLINLSMIPLAPLYWLYNWQSYWNGSAHIAARLESFTGRQTWEQLDFSARKGAAAYPSVLARGNEGMLKFDEQATLPNISVPVLVISGSHDRLTVPAASHHIEGLLKNVRQLTDPGGHLGYVEYSDLVNRAILQFAGMILVERLPKQPKSAAS